MGGAAALTDRRRASRPLDEDDVRIRPGRGTRPRTRRRPGHASAVPALVIAVDRGRYTCRVGQREVTAMRARELGRRSLAVGDRVALVGDTTGGPDALARVVRVEPRTTALRRTADDADPVERVLVANAEQLLVVAALADPPPRPGLIDRCLVAAYDAGVVPLLCLTKTDLPGTAEAAAALAERYAGLDLPLLRAGLGPAGLAGVAELRHRLAGRLTALVGHSGVGKSTLVNELVPAAGRATGAVNATTGRGRHTSSSAVAFELRGGGWVVDTPGVRSFGIAHVSPVTVLAAFPDLVPGTAGCPRGCGHLQPACALPGWVAAGHAAPARLASLQRLLAARSGEAVP